MVQHALYPYCVVSSLDKLHYDDYLYLVDSNKQQCNSTRTSEINQTVRKTGNYLSAQYTVPLSLFRDKKMKWKKRNKKRFLILKHISRIITTLNIEIPISHSSISLCYHIASKANAKLRNQWQ